MKRLVTAVLASALVLMAVSPALASENCPTPGPGFGQHIAEMAKTCEKAMFIDCVSEMATAE